MTRSGRRAGPRLPSILLDNLDIVGFDVRDTVLRLWPILLIAAGLLADWDLDIPLDDQAIHSRHWLGFFLSRRLSCEWMFIG
jgi:hypothetical protein